MKTKRKYTISEERREQLRANMANVRSVHEYNLYKEQNEYIKKNIDLDNNLGRAIDLVLNGKKDLLKFENYDIYSLGGGDVAQGKELLSSLIEASATELKIDFASGKSKLDYEALLKTNPMKAIKMASDRAKRYNDLGEFEKIEEVDATTHRKTGRLLDPNNSEDIRDIKEHISGKRYYNNIIKSNGLANEFARKAGIGKYGVQSGSFDPKAIRFQNFEQAVDSLTYKTPDGREHSIEISTYEAKNKTIYIAEEYSTGGVKLFDSMKELKAYYGIK